MKKEINTGIGRLITVQPMRGLPVEGNISIDRLNGKGEIVPGDEGMAAALPLPILEDLITALILVRNELLGRK